MCSGAVVISRLGPMVGTAVVAVNQGGVKGQSCWRGGARLCARSPPHVLSYVLLLVQMAGGGPLMRLFFYFGVLFIAREGKCGAKRREKFDCWACQHQFLVNNSHSNARCTQELLLLRLKSLLLLCVLAGWFLQERKEREANEQQQREAPRKIPRCVSCVTSISGRTTSKQSTTSAKRNMTSCLDRMTSSKQSTTSSKPSTTS